MIKRIRAMCERMAWWVVMTGLILTSVGHAEDGEITIDLSKPGVKTSPLLYGLFYEEIGCAGDGGLYAEMIENRSFENFRNGTEWGGNFADGKWGVNNYYHYCPNVSRINPVVCTDPRPVL